MRLKYIFLVVIFYSSALLANENSQNLFATADLIAKSHISDRLFFLPHVFSQSLVSANKSRSVFSNQEIENLAWMVHSSFSFDKFDKEVIPYIHQHTSLNNRLFLKQWFESESGQSFSSAFLNHTEEGSESDINALVPHLMKDKARLDRIKRLDEVIYFSELSVKSALVIQASGLASMNAMKTNQSKGAFEQLLTVIQEKGQDMIKGFKEDALIKLVYILRNVPDQQLEQQIIFWTSSPGNEFSSMIYNRALLFLMESGRELEDKVANIY